MTAPRLPLALRVLAWRARPALLALGLVLACALAARAAAPPPDPTAPVVVAARLRVATFRVPAPPRAGTAKRLRAVHRGSVVRVSWRPGRGVVRQDLVVRLGDGTRELLPLTARSRSATLRGVARATTGTVRVIGYDRSGRTAKAAVAKVGRARSR